MASDLDHSANDSRRDVLEPGRASVYAIKEEGGGRAGVKPDTRGHRVGGGGGEEEEDDDDEKAPARTGRPLGLAVVLCQLLCRPTLLLDLPRHPSSSSP